MGEKRNINNSHIDNIIMMTDEWEECSWRRRNSTVMLRLWAFEWLNSSCVCCFGLFGRCFKKNYAIIDYFSNLVPFCVMNVPFSENYTISIECENLPLKIFMLKIYVSFQIANNFYSCSFSGYFTEMQHGDGKYYQHAPSTASR